MTNRSPGEYSGEDFIPCFDHSFAFLLPDHAGPSPGFTPVPCMTPDQAAPVRIRNNH